MVLRVSDLGMRLYGFELGKVVALYDQQALRSLNPAQRRAQVLARERLQHHTRRAAALAEQGPDSDPQARAGLEAIADLMDLLYQHARDEHGLAATQPGSRARSPLAAPAQLWAHLLADPPVAAAPDDAPESKVEPDWGGPVVCRQCGLRLERTELAAAMNRPITQGWRHLDSRKTHFPEPLPLAAAGRA